ncbi:hypothetical protein K504DRAFT_505317 [Pleomassaria siparia CBS 279.74]|uniref:Uncharacterized protein n=1 Tax=Pleomassaria siparia CBS 279.74 TaxID=1314801 RepID=A0A6G1K0W1_9PLEO|nr:hypothetical protein K504DRAFT_505317 [Pleomassaria siparia CBS 279.74]
METCHLTGVIFYLSRFLKSRYPVKFDIWVQIKPPNFPYDNRGRPAGVYQGAKTAGLAL